MQEPETTEGRRTAEIGNRLRALREAKQLTQSDVTKAIGVKRTTVTRWEGGTSNPKNALEKLANFYNVSMEYINSGKTTISNEANEGRVLRIPVLGRRNLMENSNLGISQRLKMLRSERKLTGAEVAAALGVAPGTYRRWETGSNSPHRKLKELAKFYNVSTDFLIKGIETEADSRRNILRIPVLGQIAAGIPIEAIQDVEGWEEIVRPGAGDDVYYGLHIHGHSMEPRLYEGDTVIVKQTDYFEDGDMCIVLIGTKATVKIVNKLPDGILLRAYNEDVYQPHFYSAMQVETLPVRIIAVVIELRCKP